MSRVFFYCDESGAKGYANKGESFQGEVGVFAGILVPGEYLAAVQSGFDEIASRYTPASGKLHIADLRPDQQRALREEIFSAIRNAKLPCFWYAIHVAGLHDFHESQKALKAKLDEESKLARGGAEPRIKGGSPRDKPANMHVELFNGLYAHLVAFLAERNRHSVDVEIRTDQVDAPIRTRFEEVAEELLNNDPVISERTGFDTVEKVVVSRSLSVGWDWPPELDFSPTVRSLSIAIVPGSDGFVLAADVLANSLNHLFQNRDVSAMFGPLNCRDAVANHPLADHLDAFWNWGAGDCIGDGLYRHPKQPVSELDTPG